MILKVEDLQMFPKADIHPIVFDEVYILVPKNEQIAPSLNKSPPEKKQKKSLDNSKIFSNKLIWLFFTKLTINIK